jgi:hypothetical protein
VGQQYETNFGSGTPGIIIRLRFADFGIPASCDESDGGAASEADFLVQTRTKPLFKDEISARKDTKPKGFTA